MLAARTLPINSPIATRGRWHRCAVSRLALLVLWGMLPALAGAAEAGLWLPHAEHRLAFLAAIEGPWEGQARVTPIGPRPYDIAFVRTAPQQVEGAAHPGASTHYWTFSEAEETLHLRFLSTFGGNQQPLSLTAVAEQEGALIFRAPQPGFLEVRVRPQPATLVIQIFLRGKPHVEIYLARQSSGG